MILRFMHWVMALFERTVERIQAVVSAVLWPLTAVLLIAGFAAAASRFAATAPPATVQTVAQVALGLVIVVVLLLVLFLALALIHHS